MDTAIAITNIAASPQAKPDAAAQALTRIDEAAEEFEALVLAQFLAPLFSSVETPGVAGGGQGQEAFEGLLQEEYAKAFAARGGFGIADQVKAALIDMQSAQSSISEGVR